jgi:hypothetical protein
MAIFTSALTSTATSPATSYNPNLRLEYGKAAEGEDVLKAPYYHYILSKQY